VIFMVLLVVGVTALLSLRATVFSDTSTAINATGEEVSSSSKGSSISELPKTGGP
jgi:Tfp pilus assembly protein PilV